jgi:CheY-like chemotaxis protein
MRKVLIADPNTPFATVVGEALHRMGGYQAELAATGPETRAKCATLKPDLVVVDVDLPECDVPALIGQLRESLPALAVVLIPYSQNDVPPGLEIQGILTKPFFFPDLPELVNKILGQPEYSKPETYFIPADKTQAQKMTGTLIEKPVGTKPLRLLNQPVTINSENRASIEGHVVALSHSLRDEPVLLTQGKKVITIAPRLSQSAAAALTEVVTKAWQSHNSGNEVLRFEGDSESTRYMLYSLGVAGDLILSVALRVRIPLPTVRKLVREVAEQLEITVMG